MTAGKDRHIEAWCNGSTRDFGSLGIGSNPIVSTIMTVREVIQELSKLDQDKQIWVVYDGFDAFPPIPDNEIGEEDAEYLNSFLRDDGLMCNPGDYEINAG